MHSHPLAWVPLKRRCVASPLFLAGSLYLWFLDSSQLLDFLDFNSFPPTELSARADSFPMPPSRLLAMDPMDSWEKYRCLCHIVDGVKTLHPSETFFLVYLIDSNSRVCPLNSRGHESNVKESPEPPLSLALI